MPDDEDYDDFEPIPDTEEIAVTCTWRSTHVITVPRGFRIPSTLDGFPAEALEEMQSANAELVDWERG